MRAKARACKACAMRTMYMRGMYACMGCGGPYLCTMPTKGGKRIGPWVKAGNNRAESLDSDLAMARVLKEARLQSRLTQVQLGERLHLSKSSIYRIENHDFKSGGASLVGWLRYMPKIRVWLKACTVSFHFVTFPEVQETEGKGRGNGSKRRASKKSA